MKFLIIQLCDSSVSFCSYTSVNKRNLISLEILEDALLWGVKNGLNIQVLFPEYQIPESYQNLINDFEHIEIRKLSDTKIADISVIDSIDEISYCDNISIPVIYQCSISEFLTNYHSIASVLVKVPRLNIFFSDVPTFSDDKIMSYEIALTNIADKIMELYVNGKHVQFNLLTDRIMLSNMNNCNAGIDSITVSPDGNMYVCPAFYLNNGKPCGNLRDGVIIPNKHLYKIDYAPICRECDAFQCRRCVALNKQMTNEVNTPSRQQCVMSHIERNVAKKLLEEIRKYGEYSPDVSIPDIDYLDPFDKLINKEK